MVRSSRSNSDMSCDVKRGHGIFSRKHERLREAWGGSVTPNRKRDAREMAATMDHSDIRGLATAFHLFLAGLPRSRNWDHHRDARIKFVEDSPHRSRVSRYRFGVEPSGVWESVSHLLGEWAERRCSQAGIFTCRAISQMKPASSRATATQHLFWVIFRPAFNLRNRYVKRSWAFQAMSRMALG